MLTLLSRNLASSTALTAANDNFYPRLVRDNATTVTLPSGTTNPTYNALNQISTWGANTYSYDANGNTLAGDGTHSYKWDIENRVLEIDYAGTTANNRFSYDGLGRRVVDTYTYSNGFQVTTRYLWCGSVVCQTRDGPDTVLKRDLPEGEYNASSGQKLVYMPDQLGSVRDVLDATTGASAKPLCNSGLVPGLECANAPVQNSRSFRLEGVGEIFNTALDFGSVRAGNYGQCLMTEFIGQNNPKEWASISK
jgi:hypothetical protein